MRVEPIAVGVGDLHGRDPAGDAELLLLAHPGTQEHTGAVLVEVEVEVEWERGGERVLVQDGEDRSGEPAVDDRRTTPPRCVAIKCPTRASAAAPASQTTATRLGHGASSVAASRRLRSAAGEPSKAMTAEPEGMPAGLRPGLTDQLMMLPVTGEAPHAVMPLLNVSVPLDVPNDLLALKNWSV
jgi:hypothetical protein